MLYNYIAVYQLDNEIYRNDEEFKEYFFVRDYTCIIGINVFFGVFYPLQMEKRRN